VAGGLTWVTGKTEAKESAAGIIIIITYHDLGRPTLRLYRSAQPSLFNHQLMPKPNV